MLQKDIPNLNIISYITMPLQRYCKVKIISLLYLVKSLAECLKFSKYVHFRKFKGLLAWRFFNLLLCSLEGSLVCLVQVNTVL